MITSRLQAIGLSVRDAGPDLIADLELDVAPLVNPLTRAFIQRVSFKVVKDTLVAHEPPELAWIPPLPLSRVERASELQKMVGVAFDEYVFTLQRRSTELQAMGLSPHVDHATLELSADVAEGGYAFVIAADRRGNFELVRAVKDGVPMSAPAGHPFELSEHRDKAALVAYLIGLLGAQPAPVVSRPIRFRELGEKLNPDAFIPPTSPIEVVVELSANGVRYRFAAARVDGRTFRGLLASHQGKVWADRFDLDTFPGVISLVSKLLKIPPEQIKVLAGS
ncbi:MAG TPA: hypothetical protein VK447_19085 [Myxococcaceae bacterium]|nr:hypothetical protein [Myxococcaceae bacterium]